MNALKSLGLMIAKQYYQAFVIFFIVPAAVLICIMPELIQHIVEIEIGMFVSEEAAGSLKNDQIRWMFGYLKIFGFVASILASARFWWCEASGGIWHDIFSINWKTFLIGIVLFVAIGISSLPFEEMINRNSYAILNIFLSIASLPFIFVMLAGLFGDATASISHILKRSWPYLILLALLLFVGFAPWQWLHAMNHHWALGAHPAAVWLLMIFDSMVVGFMASLVGSGIAVSYIAFHASGNKG